MILNDESIDERLRRTTDWFDSCGAPRSTACMLVHGSTLTRHSWQPQIDFLSNHYLIIAPDLPGHEGLASFPFRMESAIQVLAAAVEASHSSRLLIIGASLGGHVATLFASHYPDQIAGLVISGASMNFHGLLGGWTRTVGR